MPRRPLLVGLLTLAAIVGCSGPHIVKGYAEAELSPEQPWLYSWCLISVEPDGSVVVAHDKRRLTLGPPGSEQRHLARVLASDPARQTARLQVPVCHLSAEDGGTPPTH